MNFWWLSTCPFHKVKSIINTIKELWTVGMVEGYRMERHSLYVDMGQIRLAEGKLRRVIVSTSNSSTACSSPTFKQGERLVRVPGLLSLRFKKKKKKRNTAALIMAMTLHTHKTDFTVRTHGDARDVLIVGRWCHSDDLALVKSSGVDKIHIRHVFTVHQQVDRS